jgi:hypothetical protein
MELWLIELWELCGALAAAPLSCAIAEMCPSNTAPLSAHAASEDFFIS